MGQESGDNKRLDSPLPSPGHKARSNSCNSQGQVNTTPLSKQGLLAGRSSSQRPMCKGHLYLIQKPHGSRKQDQKGQPGNLERALMQVSQQACPRSSCSRPATASAIFFFLITLLNLLRSAMIWGRKQEEMPPYYGRKHLPGLRVDRLVGFCFVLFFLEEETRSSLQRIAFPIWNQTACRTTRA